MTKKRTTRKRNPSDDYVGVLDEIASGGGEYSLSEIREGSGLPRHAARVLQVAYEAFGDGSFTRRQLVDEAARRLERSHGGRLSGASTSIEANKALRSLQDKDFLRKRPESEGSDRYFVTRGGMEMAVGDRLRHAEHSAEDAIDREIARFTERAAPRRASRPGRPTYIRPHAAARKTHPCRLCLIKHRLSAHRSHAVAAEPVETGEPPMANPRKKKRKGSRRPKNKRKGSRKRKASKKRRSSKRRASRKPLRKRKASRKASRRPKKAARRKPRKNTTPLLSVLSLNPHTLSRPAVKALRKFIKLSPLKVREKFKPFLPSEIGFNPRGKRRNPSKGKKRRNPVEFRVYESERRKGYVVLRYFSERRQLEAERSSHRVFRTRKAALAHAKEEARFLDMWRDNPSKGKKRRDSKKKRSAKRRSGSPFSSWLKSKPFGFETTWKELPAAVKRDRLLHKSAAAQARFAGHSIDRVKIEKVKRPPGASHALSEVGDVLAIEYERKGKKKRDRKHDRRKGAWRHAAGDHGRGKKKTKPEVLAIDAKTGKKVFVERRGTRAGFSSARGLTG